MLLHISVGRKEVTMQVSEALKVRRSWGSKACDHPGFEKEYYQNAPTGDYVCTQCGESFTTREYERMCLKGEIIPNKRA